MTAPFARRRVLSLAAALAGASLTGLATLPAHAAGDGDAEADDDGDAARDDDEGQSPGEPGGGTKESSPPAATGGDDDAPAGSIATRDRSVAETYSRPTPGSDFVTGGAIIGINTALEDVRAVLFAFGGYRTILPRLDQSRIVARSKGTTDVYLRAPILRGLAHVSGTVRFPPPKPYHELGIQIDGTLVKGNVEAWRGSWKAFPCGRRRTVLRLELFIDVTVPVPTSIVNREVIWACAQGVTAVRNVAECNASRRAAGSHV